MSRLTVHGGEARGRRLVAPRDIRPTQGVVVEAIFNMVANALLEAEVIDLFAGSGGLGIEALSRGAASATFVERSPAGAAAIRQNLETLGYSDRGRVARADAAAWLRTHAEEVRRARVILLDPPYRDPVLNDVLSALDAAVAPETLVVAEHWSRQPLPDLHRLEVVRDRRYGESSVTIARALA